MKINILVFIIVCRANKGAYIKYVGGEVESFTNFSKKSLVAHESIDLNISYPSNFFGKYFMAPPINFSFSFKAFL